MRIKHPERRRFRGEGARMAVGRRHVFYFPAPKAHAIIGQWPNGVALEWNLDDATFQPQTVHLTPAVNKGLKLQTTIGAVSLPTQEIGVAISPRRSVVVDEITVTDTEIVVRVPFRFEIDNRLLNAAAAE
jgi:hypothetical protein